MVLSLAPRTLSASVWHPVSSSYLLQIVWHWSSFSNKNFVSVKHFFTEFLSLLGNVAKPCNIFFRSFQFYQRLIINVKQQQCRDNDKYWSWLIGRYKYCQWIELFLHQLDGHHLYYFFYYCIGGDGSHCGGLHLLCYYKRRSMWYKFLTGCELSRVVPWINLVHNMLDFYWATLI